MDGRSTPPAGTPTGHRWLEHTADLALEIWAPTEEALLGEALRAVVEVVTEGVVPRADEERVVSLGSLDPEDRLVRWINEILYLAGSGFVPASAEVTLPDDRKLEARVRGQPGATGLVRTEIKAATYHDLAITRGPGRVAGRVVLDV